MSDTPRTDTVTLAAAMQMLARDIQSEDGVANAAIAEAAIRLADLERENAALRAELKNEKLWRKVADDRERLREQIKRECGTLTRSQLESEVLALRADKERLDWLATQCYQPGDHPDDGVLVVVSEKFASLGSFTCNPADSQKAIRAAIDAARAALAQGGAK